LKEVLESPYSLWAAMVEVNNDKYQAEFKPIRDQAIRKTLDDLKGKKK